MPDRVTLPPFELATFVVERRRGGLDPRGRDGATVARGSSPRSLVGRGSGAGGGPRSRSSVPATRCGSRTSSTRSCPTSRPTIRSATFPGALGALAPARARPDEPGRGRRACSRCATGSPPATRPGTSSRTRSWTWTDRVPDSTRWGSTTNVVMRCVPAEGAPVARRGSRAMRRASLRIARDIAATTIDAGARRRARRSARPAWTSIPACRRCAASCRSRRRGR